VLEQNLRVIDTSAVSLCRDNKIPIRVFNLYQKGNLKKIVVGNKIGTIVS
jgi:uridylate kinase